MMQITAALAIPFSITLLIGCASVDPGPFERFHESTRSFQDGADNGYKAAYDLAATGFTTPSPFGTDPSFDELLLTWEEDGDATRPSQEVQPLHAMLRDNRRGSYDLNGGIAEYARYLSLLASGSAKDAERLERLAKDANANMRSARDALKIGVDDDKIAILATLGMEALRVKIERDRRNFLRETMVEAQPTIEAFSDHMIATMNLLAGDITRTYLEWAEGQRRDHDAPGRSAAAKRKILVSLLERNDETLLLLETVRTMRDGYARIPRAHEEVRESLDAGDGFLESVRILYDDARRLQGLHKELADAT